MVSLPVSGAFVGRAAELAALQDAYREPAVHTVLVGGEAGIGKSRLVAEFGTRLDARAAVVSGRCPEFGAKGVPFAPFIAVMRALLRDKGVEALATLLPARPALARWLPGLAARSGAAEAETDSIRLFGEILTVLEQFSMTEPLVVVLEDLHWADDTSLDLLAFLVANIAERDLFLVGTYRPTDSGPLRKLVSGLRRDPSVRLLSTAPLTKHEVGRQLAALHGREPEPGTIARVFERSKGIPLFVEALGPAPEDTPAELSELLLGPLSDLPPQAASVLRLAAAAGSPVRHTVLAAAADLAEEALTTALQLLVDRQLLVPDDTGYAFRHVLIRDAVYADLLPVNRKQLHRDISRALIALRERDADDCPSGELAHHAYAAGEFSPALEAAWEAAAEAESIGAHRVQVRHLDRVLESWDRVADAASRVDAERIEVVEAVVAACYRGGVVERGIAAADEALAAIDAETEPERAARLHYYRAGLRNQSSGGGEDDLLAALACLPSDRPTLLRGEVLAELAAARAFSGAAAAAEHDARAAVEVAEQLRRVPNAEDTSPVTAGALHPPGAIEEAAGADVPSAVNHRWRSSVLRADRVAASLAARAHAYLGLATADRPDVAMPQFERAHAAAKAAGDPGTLLTVVLWETALLVSAGADEAAIAAIRQGLRAAHESYRFAEAAPILLVKWAQALTALGRWDEALDLIDASLTEQLPPLSTAAVLLCHARIMLARGDNEAAATSVATAQPLLGDRRWARQYRIQLQTVQTEIAHAAGDPRRGAEIGAATLTADDLTAHHHEAWALAEAVARTRCAPLVLDSVTERLPVTTEVDAAYRKSCRAVRSGRPADWAAAVSSWRALRRPYEVARGLLESGQAELAAGDRTAARSALRSVLGVADELAAAPLAERAGQLAYRAGIDLAEAGIRPAPARSASTSGLTPRELDVLRLVATGASNRRIAAELFISANTAGVHVSRILTKLGASSRTEAAAIARDRGLLVPEG
ncbi:AAA family ATPase [Nocardia beijingensis]|uniref:helix-turn-helix transcriptional regulator n=1 Tax=Nocardia beijingensis TaxID=95162 RepID=UPI00189503A0|nr:helix-turn-helix transcriptional regulator [Nocardia beijingensis]MBF6469452.1 AAA family ATPase [Nocardia beijingensis]